MGRIKEAKITPSQNLKEHLEFMVESYNREHSFEAIVLEHGKIYTPRKLPRGYKRGEPKFCYMNALQLILEKDGLTYVEGFAFSNILDFPFQHAWVVDDQDNVIDNTWKPHGTAYFGIPLERKLLFEIIFETKTYGALNPQSETFRKTFMKEV